MKSKCDLGHIRIPRLRAMLKSHLDAVEWSRHNETPWFGEVTWEDLNAAAQRAEQVARDGTASDRVAVKMARTTMHLIKHILAEIHSTECERCRR